MKDILLNILVILILAALLLALGCALVLLLVYGIALVVAGQLFWGSMVIFLVLCSIIGLVKGALYD